MRKHGIVWVLALAAAAQMLAAGPAQAQPEEAEHRHHLG